MKRTAVWIGLGLVFLAFGALLPTGWYDTLPRAPGLDEPPIKGVTLVRLCFAFEGFCLVIVGLSRCRPAFARRPAALALPTLAPAEGADLPYATAWVIGATALGALLRCYQLQSDLWLDEIVAVLDYRDLPVLHIVAAYTQSNNHLLNTLFVKAMVLTIGAQEWAVRLPAVLLGIASMPAQYFLARLALGRRESVLATLLLAVSYHHIFFSQNARGYSGLLLWSMLGTVFFLKALTTDHRRYWVAYMLTMFLAVATILHGFFVLAGQGLVFLSACWQLWRRQEPLLPLGRKVLTVWAILGLLCFHLYASVIPQAYVYVGSVYRREGAGYAFFSWELFEEFRRGLAAGFGSGVVLGALVATIVFGRGLLGFCQRHSLYALALVAPVATTAAFLIGLELRFSPRFFLWGVPVAFILAVAAFSEFGRWLAAVKQREHVVSWQRLAGWAPVGLACAMMMVSVQSLPAYYRTPKQPNRESLRWLEAHRRPGDVVVAVYLAEWGFRFYGPAFGLSATGSCCAVRSLDELEAIEGKHNGHRLWLLTTFPRALRLEYPELSEHIARNYAVRTTFSAIVGDGDICILVNKSGRCQ